MKNKSLYELMEETKRLLIDLESCNDNDAVLYINEAFRKALIKEIDILNNLLSKRGK